MNKRLALAFALGLCASAYAGVKVGYPVTITDYGTYHSVNGSLGTIRSSADTMQWLACSVSSFAGNTSVNCAARDAAGTYITCHNSTNADMRTIISAINDSSYVSFQTDPANTALCRYIYVTNGSQHPPKVP